MKKCTLFMMTVIIAIALAINNISVSAYHSRVYQGIDLLEKYDVVRDPTEKWSELDFITRRDALKMPYIIAFIHRMSPRQYIVTSEDTNWAHEFLNKSFDGKVSTYFEDVELNSNDDRFVLSLEFLGMISGKEFDGKYYADLDSYMTYNEALATTCRLIRDWNSAYNFPYQPPADKSFFMVAEEIGLINNNNAFNLTSPIVQEEQLDKPIPAYEYMYMLYTALYLPGDRWPSKYLIEMLKLGDPASYDPSLEDIKI